MARVRKTVSLHEKTVQNAEQHTRAKAKKASVKRRRPTNTHVQVSIWSDNVNELIVDWAEENHIHWSQIEIVDEDTIIVHNPEGN